MARNSSPRSADETASPYAEAFHDTRAGRPPDTAVPVPQRPSRTVRPRDLIWPVLLSLGVLGIIVALTYEEGALRGVTSSFKPTMFALALGALAVQISLGAVRLRHVSHRLLSLKKGYRAQLTWDFLSAITPSALGGGPFAAVLIAKENGVGYGRVISWMLFCMLLDQVWFAIAIASLFVAAVWLPVFPTALGAASVGPVAIYMCGLLCWTAFFGYATLFRPVVIERLATWVVRIKWLRRFEDRVQAETSKLRRQAKILRGQPARFYLEGFAYSMTIWIARYSVALFVALSVLPADFPFREILYLFRTAALLLVGIVMPTPGGSGGLEGLFVLFLGPLLPAGFTGPVVIGWRVITYYLILVIGVFVAGSALQQMFGAKTEEAASSV